MPCRLWIAVLCCTFAATAAFAQDPVVSDADKYTVRFENERVRVLEYHDTPGQKTTLHHHPDFVLYAIGPFKRRLTFADGRSTSREFKGGETLFMQAQDHVGENIGDTDTHVIIVEMK